MSLTKVLRPLLTFDGLIAVMVITRDGLPVEAIGHNLEGNRLAAEIATIAEAGRNCFTNLQMGQVKYLRISLEQHEVSIFSFELHYLVVIYRPNIDFALVEEVIENNKAKIYQELGGQS